MHAPHPSGRGGNDASNKSHPAASKNVVLVLPFDNLKVVEQAHGVDFNFFNPTRVSDFAGPNKVPTITMESRDLVRAIHAAASDPNVTALYADFGEGMRHPMALAHAEEVRDAVRVFNESHRVHREPNLRHDPVFAMMRNGEPKSSHAFGREMNWSEYFLASAFGCVHLQTRGRLNLYGGSKTDLFVRGMLDKYGIGVHVFRHGDYKTMPSMVTDKKYSRPHLESVKSLVSSHDDTIRTGIENSRSAMKFDNVMWRSIFDFGSLSSANAEDIGLVDSTTPVDPLRIILNANRTMMVAWIIQTMLQEGAESKGNILDANMKELAERDLKGLMDSINDAKAKLGKFESFMKMRSTSAIPLEHYAKMLKMRDRVEGRRRIFQDVWHKLSSTSTATSMILSGLGLLPTGVPSSIRDKVAVVTVDGNIDRKMSYKIVNSLRSVRMDNSVKAMVLRVNSPGGSIVSSETILEEIKLFDKPVICSMSNYAASGGYYIAMNSEKIFAQPTTITGSIGVFAFKVDASKWASSYGIHSDSHPHGSHATALHPLVPLTTKTKDNISRLTSEHYDYFKSIVSSGRSLTAEEVENIAQGRVWTGEQAKERGLVDALGGLDRAISYTKAAHTKGEVDVIYFPKKPSMREKLLSLQSQASMSYLDIFQSFLNSMSEKEEDHDPPSIEQLVNGLTDTEFAEKPHFLMTMDEKTAIEIILGRK